MILSSPQPPQVIYFYLKFCPLVFSFAHFDVGKLMRRRGNIFHPCWYWPYFCLVLLYLIFIFSFFIGIGATLYQWVLQDSVFREGNVCGMGVLSCFVFFKEKIAPCNFNLCWFIYLLFACDYLPSGILCMIHIFCFLQGWFGFLFLIVRGTSFTELSVVFNWGNFVDFWSRTALKIVWKDKWCGGECGCLLVENFVAKSHFVGFKLGKKKKEGGEIRASK